MWNLDKLAVALKPIIDSSKHSHLQTILRGYGELYHKYINQIFRKKLGLTVEEEDDEKLVDILLAIMEAVQADYTQTFRDLSELSLDDLRAGSIPEEGV